MRRSAWYPSVNRSKREFVRTTRFARVRLPMRRLARDARRNADLTTPAQPVVAQDEADHRFDQRDGAGQDAGIVASAWQDRRRLAAHVDGVLRPEDRGDRLERDRYFDGHAVADAALDAAGAVGAGADRAILRDEGVVV